MLHAWESPPTFYSNVDMILGEGDLDILTQNAILLDAMSFRAPEVMSSSAGKDTGTVNAYSPLISTEVIWRGSFLMQAGMTDVDIEGWAQKGASEDFQLFLNGVGISTNPVPNGGTFALNIDISALAPGTVGQVVLQRSGALTGPQALAAKYVVYDAFAYPAPTIALSWGGVPSFSGTYSAALLNQLGVAQAYVAARLNAIPYLPFLAAYYVHGSSVTGDVYPLWWGAVERANGSNILNIRIIYMNFGNVAEFYRVKVNGSTVHTSSTFGVGDTDDSYLSIDVSAFSASVRLETVIETVVTTGPVDGPSGNRNSRYHLWAVRMSNSAPATAAAPTEFTAGEDTSDGTNNTRLNALCTMVNGAKARLDANPRIFNRIRLVRQIYGRNSEQYSTFAQANTYVQRTPRRGARLFVYGKAVKVGWGAISTKADRTVTTAYTVDFAHSEALTDGDAYQTKIVYMDGLPFLRRGQTLTVYGEDAVLSQEYLL
jgi:hypothetical protein